MLRAFISRGKGSLRLAQNVGNSLRYLKFHCITNNLEKSIELFECALTLTHLYGPTIHLYTFSTNFHSVYTYLILEYEMASQTQAWSIGAYSILDHHTQF